MILVCEWDIFIHSLQHLQNDSGPIEALRASEPCMSHNDSFLLRTKREDRRWSRNQVNDLHSLMLSTASYSLGFHMIIYDGPWYDSLGSEALKMGHCDLSLGYKSCLEENSWWSCLWSTFAIYRTSSTSITFSDKKICYSQSSWSEWNPMADSEVQISSSISIFPSLSHRKFTRHLCELFLFIEVSKLHKMKATNLKKKTQATKNT